MRHRRRTDTEWLDIITECRASGMSDKAWCEAHNIHTSKLYYHIKRLRNKSCCIPEAVFGSQNRQPDRQEVVAIDLSQPDPVRQMPFQAYPLEKTVPDMEVAIRVNLNGIQLEISNNAAQDTILNTLSALQKLC